MLSWYIQLLARYKLRYLAGLGLSVNHLRTVCCRSGVGGLSVLFRDKVARPDGTELIECLSKGNKCNGIINYYFCYHHDKHCQKCYYFERFNCRRKLNLICVDQTTIILEQSLWQLRWRHSHNIVTRQHELCKVVSVSVNLHFQRRFSAMGATTLK